MSTENIEIPKSSHIMTGDYAVLQETSGEEMESWLYFIRVEGNEENLKHLQDQLEKVDWYILDDMSTFDLDLEHYVSAQTAKEMTKVELNHCSFHRKFDGKLKRIDFEFNKKDKNKKKIRKVFEIIGYGLIENFIDDEDIDPEDLVSDSDSDTTDTEDESVSSSDSEDRKHHKQRGNKYSHERDTRDRHDRRDRSESHRDFEENEKKDYNIPPSLRLRDSLREKQNERRKGGGKKDES